MGKKRRVWELLTEDPGLGAEVIPGKPIIEISGDCRVLIENHFCVKAYSQESILIKVKSGYVCVCGSGLELLRMTKEQIVIHGRIHSVVLKRGEYS